MSEVKEQPQEAVKDEHTYTLLFPYTMTDGRELKEINLRPPPYGPRHPGS